MKYGEPMDLAAVRAEARTCGKDRLKQIYQEVSDAIMAAIARLQPATDRPRFP